jgi:hydroxymethylpyrimidine pyrophosphatase-like HAD family hydrolase
MKTPGPHVISQGVVETLVDKVVSTIQDSHVKNGAVAFDIDETLLFWGDANSSNPNAVVAHPHVSKLFDAAAKKDYKIFIITARPKTQEGLAYAVRQLDGLGYDLSYIPEGGVFLQNKEYYDSKERNSTGMFKHDVRKLISEEYGYNVILMVGDQWTDVFEDGASGWRSLNKNEDEHFFEVTDRIGVLIAYPDKHTGIGFKLPSLH